MFFRLNKFALKICYKISDFASNSIINKWIWSFFAIWLIQFRPNFIICSITLSLLLSFKILEKFPPISCREFRPSSIIVYFLTLLSCTGILNFLCKMCFGSSDDGHIGKVTKKWNFVMIRYYLTLALWLKFRVRFKVKLTG